MNSLEGQEKDCPFCVFIFEGLSPILLIQLIIVPFLRLCKLPKQESAAFY